MLKRNKKASLLVGLALILVVSQVTALNFAQTEDDFPGRPPFGKEGRPPVEKDGVPLGGQDNQMDNRPDMTGFPPQRGSDMKTGTGLKIFDYTSAESTGDITDTKLNNVSDLTYPVVDTNQTVAFDEKGGAINPDSSDKYYGQDSNYSGYQPSYKDNGDGTVTDLVTGLMWQKDPGEKMGLTEAVTGADTFALGGYDDWRLPTIKELYSLIQFSGTDPDVNSQDDSSLIPFIDTNYFDFVYGDTEAGERIIDSQFASSTIYESTTMGGVETVFGVNFADGRIKGYPIDDMRSGTEKQFFVLYVRGNSDYGENDFIDNGDGTITDLATGLMWMQNDSGEALSWSSALEYAEDLSYAGYTDWRLPDAKELQSIVDYTRSPDTTNSAAIDPVFDVTQIIDEGGNINYPFFWTGTSHIRANTGGQSAVYIAFGEALGYMTSPRSGQVNLQDVHGAGAQRSDMKIGNVEDYETGHGPQGDVVRINNYARAVRSIEIED